MRKKQLLALLDTLFRGTTRVRVKRAPSATEARSRENYLANKKAARIFIEKKLTEWNRHYGFVYHRIAIRDQRSRWGSCSKKGNLNFNYRLLYLPESLADLVIVHELCHLKEFNHSPAFWRLVGETIPDYAKQREALKRFSLQERRGSNAVIRSL